MLYSRKDHICTAAMYYKRWYIKDRESFSRCKDWYDKWYVIICEIIS